MSTIRERMHSADRTNVLFAALVVSTALMLLILGRGMTFYYDEWPFIDGRGQWDLATFMKPHNEHWSAGAILIYKILLATFGLRTYLPYQIVVVLLHLAVATALYRLVRREAGPHLALCTGTIFLWLGFGGESLLWPAEIGWNGAIAAGAWALVLTLRLESVRHPIAAAVLLVVAVATSGVGLPFVVVVALGLMLTAERRRQLWLVVPAVAIYGIWYVAIGRHALQSGLFDPANLKDVQEYMVLAIGNAVGSTTGWGPDAGLILATLLVVATLWRSLSERPLLIGAVVGVVGLLTHFALIGLARARFGIDHVDSPRYVYAAAFFVLLALASWLATRIRSIRNVRVASVMAALVGVAVATNLFALIYLRTFFLDASEQVRASITVITRFGGSPALPASKGVLPIPGRERLDQLLAMYGSPLRDTFAPVADPSPSALDSVLLGLVGDQLSVTEGAQPVGTVAPQMESVSELTVTGVDGCVALVPTGSSPSAVTHVEPGASLVITSSTGGTGKLRISLYGTFPDAGTRDLVLAPNTPNWIHLPDLGPGVSWLLELAPPVTGSARVCLSHATVALLS